MASSVIIEASNPDLKGMGGTVTQQRKPGSDVNLMLAKIKSINANNWAPESWNNATRKNNGKRPRYPCQVSINDQLDFAERRKPYKVPAVDSKVFTSELKVFVYQNSSVACPQAERLMTALAIF